MSLSTPESVQKLRAALHAKAKGSPEYRFYVLYDKVYRADVLAYAYASSKANGGGVGVDGQNFVDIETYGLERWLGELTESLPDRGRSRPASASSVVVCQAQGQGSGNLTLS